MDVGERIVTLREGRSLTQYALAKVAGIAQPSLLDIERGKVQPNIVTLRKLCSALGITLAEFFTEPGLSDPPPLERELLTVFRALDEDKQQQAVRVVRSL